MCGHSMTARDGMRCFALVAATIGLTSLSACTSEAPHDRLRVAVTVAPLAGLVDRLAPDLADVTIMIPPGANPVAYEPSLSRVRAASAAELYVSVGHPAFVWEEAWLAELLQGRGATVVSAAGGCELIPDDPHVWLSVPCARSAAERLAEALRQVRPQAASVVDSSLSSFLAEMDSLKEAADGALGARAGGSFVVLHPAWGYVVREYDISQIAILDHGSGDAGPAALAAIVDRARSLGIRNVIVQPQFSAGPASLVAEELGGETVMLDPLMRDWSEGYRSAVSVLAAQVRP